jgi:hypothetical protein
VIENEQLANSLFTKSSQNAYSFFAYSEDEWRKSCEYLLSKFDFDTSMTVLCSKLTRHCRDLYSDNGAGKAEHVKTYIETLSKEQLNYYLCLKLAV